MEIKGWEVTDKIIIHVRIFDYPLPKGVVFGLFEVDKERWEFGLILVSIVVYYLKIIALPENLYNHAPHLKEGILKKK